MSKRLARMWWNAWWLPSKAARLRTLGMPAGPSAKTPSERTAPLESAAWQRTNTDLKQSGY